MLVVYDQKGTVYFGGTGYPTPVGIPYLETEIPEGKRFVGVNVDVEPNEPIFEDIPKSDIDILKEEVATLKAQNAALLEGAKQVTE